MKRIMVIINMIMVIMKRIMVIINMIMVVIIIVLLRLVRRIMRCQVAPKQRLEEGGGAAPAPPLIL